MTSSRVSKALRSCSLPVTLALSTILVIHYPKTASAQAPKIRFPVSETVVEVGDSRIVPFRIEPAPASSTTVSSEIENPEIAEILRPGQVMTGETLGTVRLFGIATGTTELRLGDAIVTLRVVPKRAPFSDDRYTPKIVSPSPGAWVWGRVAVGIRTNIKPRALGVMTLHVSGGLELKPVSDTGSRYAPSREVRFELDTNQLPPGPAVLTTWIDGAPTGRPVRIFVLHPDPGSVLTREAEAPFDGERPPRFSNKAKSLGRDPGASGGTYFVNDAAQPAACVPVEVESPGFFQLLLTASGSRAQGILPTVEVVVDGSSESITNGLLLDEEWHRIAVGIPFHLEPGLHVLTPHFVNDFWKPGLADRNLFLDRIEIARVDPLHPEEAEDLYARSPSPLHLSLIRPFHGRVVPGLFEIDARCWWPELETVRPPIVTLFVNGEETLRQRSGAPYFSVDPSLLAPGKNVIELVARLDSGTTARTSPQTVISRNPPQAGLIKRGFHRFTLHDERWEGALRENTSKEFYPRERLSAVVSPGETRTLTLPDSIQGEWSVFLEARAEKQGRRVRAHIDSGEIRNSADIASWWQSKPLGTIHFEGEKNTLRLACDEKGDDRLLVQSIQLLRENPAPDQTPPGVEILYPHHETIVHGTDVVVADAWDDRSLAAAELLVDGMRIGITQNLGRRPGRIVIPLLLDSVDPGEHRVALRITDRAGNSLRSEPRIIRVVDALGKPTRYQRAIRLLDRFAFGPDPEELATILTLGEERWLENRLSSDLTDPADRAAFRSGFSFFASRSLHDVPRRVLHHLLVTPNPVRARFVLWAQNHFSTWIRKSQSEVKWNEHVLFSELGVAPFPDLLLASSQHPSMLRYLDQDTSFVDRINENYAREIMELHTLGVEGGYSQTDVTALARLLTGWTVALEGDGRSGSPALRSYTFRFDPHLNDGGAIELLGMEFEETPPSLRYDRAKSVLELLASHPSTARFVSEKLVEHYVGTPAPPSLVGRLATVFHRTAGDFRALLTTIARSEEFWKEDWAERPCRPLDFAMRLSRTTGQVHPWAVADFLTRSGYGLFDRATPDGYPEDDAGAGDANELLQRFRLAHGARWPLCNLVPSSLRHDRHLPEDRWRETVVDVLSVRLTGRLLSLASREAALDLLGTATGSRDQRVLALAPFLAKLPESQLR